MCGGDLWVKVTTYVVYYTTYVVYYTTNVNSPEIPILFKKMAIRQQVTRAGQIAFKYGLAFSK